MQDPVRATPAHTSPHPASNYSPALPLLSRFTRKSKNEGIFLVRARVAWGRLPLSAFLVTLLRASPLGTEFHSNPRLFLSRQLISDTYPLSMTICHRDREPMPYRVTRETSLAAKKGCLLDEIPLYRRQEKAQRD